MLVGQDQHRDLIFFGDVECLDGQGVGLFGGPRRIHDPGKFAMARREDEFQVGLLCARGKACCRARPLGIDDHNRRLRHTGQAHAFHHQAESAA